MITLVGGARPNWPKIAPIVRELDRRSKAYRIIHTGQHAGSALDIYEELQLPPPAVCFTSSGTHAEQTANVMVRVEADLLVHRPRWLVLVGDVNSTLGAALAAGKLGVKIAHVEAGLRSGDWAMPEEMNRVLVDAMADLWLTPTNDFPDPPARARAAIVGNVMIDSLRWALTRPCCFEPAAAPYALMTIHRPSNVDTEAAKTRVLEIANEVSRHLRVIWPVHPRLKLDDEPDWMPGVRFIKPLPYVDMVHAMKGAAVVLTDSGGVQEETTALGVPCLTLRENTERPVTVTEGTNTVVGVNLARVLHYVERVLGGTYKRGGVPALWDGRAAARIVDALLQSHCNP